MGISFRSGHFLEKNWVQKENSNGNAADGTRLFCLQTNKSISHHPIARERESRNEKYPKTHVHFHSYHDFIHEFPTSMTTKRKQKISQNNKHWIVHLARTFSAPSPSHTPDDFFPQSPSKSV